MFENRGERFTRIRAAQIAVRVGKKVRVRQMQDPDGVGQYWNILVSLPVRLLQPAALSGQPAINKLLSNDNGQACKVPFYRHLCTRPVRRLVR